MQVSVENTGGLERRMTVQVPAERIDQEVGSRLESMSRTVRLDGFRPGKVPVRVIQQKYGDQVRQAREHLLWFGFRLLLHSLKFRADWLPVLSTVHLSLHQVP